MQPSMKRWEFSFGSISNTAFYVLGLSYWDTDWDEDRVWQQVRTIELPGYIQDVPVHRKIERPVDLSWTVCAGARQSTRINARSSTRRCMTKCAKARRQKPRRSMVLLLPQWLTPMAVLRLPRWTGQHHHICRHRYHHRCHRHHQRHHHHHNHQRHHHHHHHHRHLGCH